MRDELAGARRVVVKVGSSSDDRRGRYRPATDRAACRRTRRREVGGPGNCLGVIRCHRRRALTARTPNPPS